MSYQTRSTRRPRRARALLAALAAGAGAALILSGCSTSSQPSSGGGGSSSPQVLTFGLSAVPAAPITGMYQGGAINQLLSMVHRGLMTWDQSGKLAPGLAETVDTPDPATYVFTLRNGLKFSDGTALTAENVKHSLDYYRDAANGSSLAAGLKDVQSVEAKGSTVTVTLAQPNTAFLQYLAIPAAAIVPDASLNAKTPNWIGAGPFEMSNIDDGIGITMTKNKDYYDAKDVSLSEIDVKFYADGEARTNALLSGDVDLIEYVPWENFQRVKDAGFTVDAQQGPYQYVQFNVTKGPFANPKVREAVAYAINRDNAVKAAFQSNGAPLTGIVLPKNDPAYDANLSKLWKYDPTKAKQLLAEAGYPNGFSATLLSTSQYTFLQDNALSVQEDLRAIGIDVKLDAPDWSTRVSKGNAGEYDLAVSGDAGVITDPSYLLTSVVDAKSFNVSYGYGNDELRGLIDKGLRASDKAEKRAIYQDVAKLWAQDVPFASINTREQAYAFSSKVKGFKTLPGFLVFYSSNTLAQTSLG